MSERVSESVASSSRSKVELKEAEKKGEGSVVVVIVVVPGGEGGEGKTIRGGRDEEIDVEEEVEWQIECGRPKGIEV